MQVAPISLFSFILHFELCTPYEPDTGLRPLGFSAMGSNYRFLPLKDTEKKCKSSPGTKRNSEVFAPELCQSQLPDPAHPLVAWKRWWKLAIHSCWSTCKVQFIKLLQHLSAADCFQLHDSFKSAAAHLVESEFQRKWLCWLTYRHLHHLHILRQHQIAVQGSEQEENYHWPTSHLNFAVLPCSVSLQQLQIQKQSWAVMTVWMHLK